MAISLKRERRYAAATAPQRGCPVPCSDAFGNFQRKQSGHVTVSRETFLHVQDCFVHLELASWIYYCHLFDFSGAREVSECQRLFFFFPFFFLKVLLNECNLCNFNFMIWLKLNFPHTLQCMCHSCKILRRRGPVSIKVYPGPLFRKLNRDVAIWRDSSPTFRSPPSMFLVFVTFTNPCDLSGVWKMERIPPYVNSKGYKMADK